MQSFEAEIVLRRSSRAELFEDVEAVSTFLEQRHRARTGTPDVTAQGAVRAAQRIVESGGATA